MRNLFSMVLFAIVTPVFAQQPPQEPKQPPPPTRKVSEYKKTLSDLKTWSGKLTDEKWYEERFSFIDQDTKKEKKFADFSVFDRKMFQMTTTQRFNYHLAGLETAWKTELKKATAAKIADSKGDDKAVAGADDIKEMIDALHAIRVVAAASWEAQATTIFKEFPKEFGGKDRDHYLKNIKELKDSLEK